jgi:RNA polymerase sigma-70 factor, ECF subfamily
MLVVNTMPREQRSRGRELEKKQVSERDIGQDDLADTTLVALARDGNRSAYEVLVKRYQRKSLTVAHEIMRSREDAEDVVQDALIKAFRGLKFFKGESRFSTWLYRIIYTTAIDAKRKRSRRGGDTREYDESLHEAACESGLASEIIGGRFTGPEQVAQQNQELGLLSEALDTLSEEHRTVLVLREIDGLAYEEIADVVGVTKGTVMSRLFYARKRLLEVTKELQR